MLDPSFAESTFSTWAAPAVGILAAALVTAVVSAVIGRARDKRRTEEQDAEKEQTDRDAADLLLRSQVAAVIRQVGEMHVALLGEDPTPWNPHPRPGLVSRVENVEETLFSNGGAKNTVLDRLGRIETIVKGPESGS